MQRLSWGLKSQSSAEETLIKEQKIVGAVTWGQFGSGVARRWSLPEPYIEGKKHASSCVYFESGGYFMVLLLLSADFNKKHF